MKRGIGANNKPLSKTLPYTLGQRVRETSRSVGCDTGQDEYYVQDKIIVS